MRQSSALENCSSWQAVNHPELSERKPEELFDAEFADGYTRLHRDLWEGMLRVHGNILSLEELREFRFDYIYGPNEMEFWHLVVSNFVDMSCVLLHGLVSDEGSDVHSLTHFKNKIAAAKWKDPRLHELFLRTLRERKFDSNVTSVAKRIADIRNKRLAHRLVDRNTAIVKQLLGTVSLPELRQLYNSAHKLFGALSFGAAYETLAGDLAPSTVGGRPTRTCLGTVLDAVARDSDFVNEPERRGPWWSRDRRSDDELRSMNELRLRVGLPAV